MDGIIYNCYVIVFTINLEVISSARAQSNESLQWNRMQRRDATSAETHGSKTSSLFENVGNFTSSS